MGEDAAPDLREGRLRVGWARRDITPSGPVSLQGQFHERISRGVQSPLTATVLALETRDGQGRVIDQTMAASCDLCTISRELQDDVRKALSGRLSDFDLRKLFITATHIHTGPFTQRGYSTAWHIRRFIPDHLMEPVSPAAGVVGVDEYRGFLIEQLCAAFEQAWASRAPGSVGWELGHAVVGHNRRVSYADGSSLMYGSPDTAGYEGPEGPSDHGVELLYFWDAGGRLTGVAVDIPCPAQVMESLYVVSADYWGEARRILGEQYGEGLFVLPLCGAAGDQSPRDLARRNRGEPDMRQLEGAVEMGRRAARAVLDRMQSAAAHRVDRLVFSHRVEDVDLPVRTVSDREYQKAKAEFAGILACVGPGEKLTTAHWVRLHAPGGIMDRYETQRARGVYSPEVHYIRLGDVAVMTQPFELFMQYSLQIKARAKAMQTLVVQLTGDLALYLPTGRAVRGGHYSAIVASGIVGPEAGRYLVNHGVERLNALWE